MALTTSQTNNRGIKFRNQVIREFVRKTMFRPYTGEDQTAVIRRLSLGGVYGGDQINVPLIRALNNQGLSTGTLVGSEEAMQTYGVRFWIDWARNAVTAQKSEIKRNSFDLFGQAAPLLAEWAAKITKNETILAFQSLPSEAPPAGLLSANGQRVNGILFSAATTGQLNTYITANADRLLFGNAIANLSAGNWTTSLNNITNTMNASAAVVRLMKLMAKRTGIGADAANPRIHPLTLDDGYERFVLFCGANAFRDLLADATINAANSNARPREGTKWKQNPIFMDGDLLYDGVIIREVPEIDAFCSVNNATPLQCAPMFLCGTQALSWVVSEEAEATQLKQDDYQFLRGAGIEMSYGIGKNFFNNGGNLVDWGQVTSYVYSPN